MARAGALLVAAGLAALCACAPRGTRAPAADWPLPDPAAAPFSGRRLQDVRLEAPGRPPAHLLAALERRKGGVFVVGLSPEGRRLVRLDWDAAGVRVETSPGWPPSADPRRMLAALAFALWPPEALERAFAGTAWSLHDAPGRRTLERSGAVWLSVRREDGALVLEGPALPVRVAVRELPEDAAP